MYGITLTQALVLFIGITQVVATPIPQDGDKKAALKKFADKFTSKPIVHEEDYSRYGISLPEWYRKRSADKPKPDMGGIFPELQEERGPAVTLPSFYNEPPRV